MATVVITGANRGIGLHLARLYAEAGDKVIACCRDPDSAGDLQALQGDIDIRRLDPGSDESCADFGKALAGAPVEVLINNAGTLGPAIEQQTLTTLDTEAWLDTFNVNTLGPVRVTQALLPNLRATGGGAKAVTITSQLGALAFDLPRVYAYSASKAAVNKFMRLAGIELGKEGIHVGLVHPGWVQTDMGGPKADLTPAESAAGVVRVIHDMQGAGFWNWNGEEHAW